MVYGSMEGEIAELKTADSPVKLMDVLVVAAVQAKYTVDVSVQAVQVVIKNQMLEQEDLF